MAPLVLNCPLSAMEIAVHMCKDRNLVEAEKVVEELVLTMRMGVNIWADNSMKDAVDHHAKDASLFPNMVRVEGLYLENIDEKSIKSFLAKYQKYIQAVTARLEGGGEEEHVMIVSLMTKVMRSTISPEIKKRRSRREGSGDGNEARGGEGVVTKQGMLCSEFISKVLGVWEKIGARGWNNRSTFEAFLIQCVLAIVDDFLRWCNEVYAKLYSSIEREALGR